MHVYVRRNMQLILCYSTANPEPSFPNMTAFYARAPPSSLMPPDDEFPLAAAMYQSA